MDLPEAEAEVDVCEACGGMWVDWFDGEVRKIATETLRISDPNLKAAEPVDEASIGACPRCSKHLVAERYVMTAEVQRDSNPGRISLVGGPESGAELLRCEDCMGAFVTRPSAEVLAFLDSSEEPPRSVAPSVHPMPWERLVKLLKSLIGMK